MRRGWGALVAFAWALGVLVALAAATPMCTAAPARAAAAMASILGDAQPTLSEAPSASSPASGADARDVDNDDDSDDDGSLVAATIAVERPPPRRLAHRPAESASHAPPDAQPLLRPPSPGVG